MGKIKGWTKNTSGLNHEFKEIKWTNNISSNFINVVYDGEQWRIWTFDTFGGDEEIIPWPTRGKLITKEEAVKIAVEWMRTHPRGY